MDIALGEERARRSEVRRAQEIWNAVKQSRVFVPVEMPSAAYADSRPPEAASAHQTAATALPACSAPGIVARPP